MKKFRTHRISFPKMFTKATNFLDIINPNLQTCYLLGLFPYKFTNSNIFAVERTKNCRFYLNVALLAIFIIIDIASICRNKLEFGNVNDVVVLFQVYGNIIYTKSTLFFAWAKQEELWNAIAHLLQFDVESGLVINYPKSRRRGLFITFAVYFLTTAMILADVKDFFFKMVDVISPYAVITYLYVYLVSAHMDLLFFELLDAVRTRYCLLADGEVAGGDFRRLWECCRCFNAFFLGQILLKFVLAYIYVLHCLFIFWTQWSTMRYWHEAAVLAWLVFMASEVVATLYYYEAVSLEEEKCRRIFITNARKSEIRKSRESKVNRCLVNRVDFEKTELSLHSTVPLKLKSLFSICGSLLTHFIVLVQFHSLKSNKSS